MSKKHAFFCEGQDTLIGQCDKTILCYTENTNTMKPALKKPNSNLILMVQETTPLIDKLAGKNTWRTPQRPDLNCTPVRFFY